MLSAACRGATNFNSTKFPFNNNPLCNSKNQKWETIKQEECLRSSLQLFCGGPPASSWFRLANDFFRQLHAAIANSGLWNSISPASSWLPPPSTSWTPSSVSRLFGYLQLYHRLTTERERTSVYENPPFCLHTGVNIKTTHPGGCSLHPVPCSLD